MPQKFSPTQALPGGPEPAFIGTKELLIERALARLRSIPGPLEQYTFLASLRSRNADVFYGLVGGNMKECCVSPGLLRCRCLPSREVVPAPLQPALRRSRAVMEGL